MGVKNFLKCKKIFLFRFFFLAYNKNNKNPPPPPPKKLILLLHCKTIKAGVFDTSQYTKNREDKYTQSKSH
jgi:hypothetical protein